ncbi:YdbL family protein [Pelagibius sp. 7325]|uniref:YdbL family protein n=1 Tax=Pelagibius sp. 7325 TaxID=3131994 RepID=UPI0030ECF4A2
MSSNDGSREDGIMTPKLTRRRFSLFALMAAAFLVLPLLSGPVAAQTLDELRAAGKVGERYDGYAVARDPNAAGMVEEINAKRREIYEAQATKQGVPASQVGAVYAGELWQKVPAGTWFLTADGEWRKK